MKQVELLAPAGNYECFLAALRAGADAVYFGGTKFGARAYADNFTEEEIYRAIVTAHLWKRKVYLTLNTLIKEEELPEAAAYVRPFYECGLDGVIVQDIGIFQLLKNHFPGMELHCSTQMTITGKYGAAFAKEMGADRIVPARELSLMEIQKIQEEVDIEIECFIHGAMCYCYSGQCLFSSILGGRSGNRGRCAQPCRLPYRTSSKGQKECYPLSLKDMCTIDHIPKLIQAGISSFKIEGRMKKAEYVAGVTGIYRKYIDLYYENPNREWSIDKKDRQILNSLYIRSQVQDGYYFKRNGKEMVTFAKPGYSGNEETVLKQIQETYLAGKLQLPAKAECTLLLNHPAAFTVTAEGISVTVTGQAAEAAKNAPVTKEQVQTQLGKTGNTNFVFQQISVNMEEPVFYPMKALNELRREALNRLEEEILKKNCPNVKNRQFMDSDFGIMIRKEKAEAGRGKVFVELRNRKQLRAVLENPWMDALILDACLCEGQEEWEQVCRKLKENAGTIPVYLASPYIIREQDTEFLEKFVKCLNQETISGCLFRNLETYYYLQKQKFGKTLMADTNLSVFNTQSYEFWNQKKVRITFPYELNAKEIRRLRESGVEGIKPVYGRIPMMVTANCVKKTMNGCDKKGGVVMLTDRYQVRFPVIAECSRCYNIIYNSAPLSLHKTYDRLLEYSDCRISFTTESGEETAGVLAYFRQLSQKNEGNVPCPYSDYTTGHEKRGVE